LRWSGGKVSDTLSQKQNENKSTANIAESECFSTMYKALDSISNTEREEGRKEGRKKEGRKEGRKRNKRKYVDRIQNCNGNFSLKHGIFWLFLS
jgi:hypothetical protein